jgi:predicted amino acid racemase
MAVQVLIDVEPSHLMPVNEKLNIVGASSDMIVVDLGSNPDQYNVGDLLEFRMDYMGILRIMNSDYIDKRVANDQQSGPNPSIKKRPFQMISN